MVLYFNRTVSRYGNNFQWKINVAIRTISHLLSSALCFLLFALLCSAVYFLLSALHSAGSALPALLFLLPARWGGYPFSKKTKYHFLPPKIPAIFSKTSPYPSIFNTPLT